MVNTRDEPHADRHRWRRLHLIIGDANLFEVATYLKLGTTSLVLFVIEQLDALVGRRGRPPRLCTPSWRHCACTTRWPTCRRSAGTSSSRRHSCSQTVGA
ncbi:proteasome accessory factor PafA2 family protein [Oerskovia sp. M15]